MQLGKSAVLCVTLLALAFPTSHSTIAAQDKSQNLYTLKKIFVREETCCGLTPVGIKKEQRRITAFKQELAHVGFTIVSEDEADAVLSGTFGLMVVFDGPQPDPPDYVYEYQLTTPSKENLWQIKFHIRSRANEAEVDQKAAQKLALKLCKDSQRSAKNAGVVSTLSCS